LERELAIAIPVGQRAENLGDASVVVASAAIKESNPELAAARQRGLEVVSRAQMLGRVMDLYETRIAVSGTHGKTTTSAMIALMLEHAGMDPTALIGGDVPQWQSNARLGHGKNFVAEACEAYSSFLDLRPTISVITNVEADHLDHYETLENIVKAFEQFLSSTSRLAILWADDPHTPRLSECACRTVTFGFGDSGQLRACREENFGLYTIWRGSERMGSLRLGVPGKHNVLNALAAVAVGLEMGIPYPEIAEGLAAFVGTGRRFERLGETDDGIAVIDDYAHHPTEIRATLAAARQAFPGRRIIAVFQPHLPSRTRDLMDDFATAFVDADLAVLTDIYLAREAADPAVTGEVLALRVGASLGADRTTYVADKHNLPDALKRIAWPKDVILTLGAGDIREAGERFLRNG
jgi:UDP-N-acetylmuramate--alanine ligase